MCRSSRMPMSDRIQNKLDRGIWSKSNDLRDCLVVFSKKLDPLTWFILRVLYVIHIDTADRTRIRCTLSIRCRERYEQLPQFIPLFCTESFLAFLVGIPLLSLSVAFKCTYGLVPQLHFDQSMKPPRRHFYCRGLSGFVTAADKRFVFVINVASNVMRITI